MLIIGIDLAWGDKKPDGVCVIESSNSQYHVVGYAYPKGDTELIGWVRAATSNHRNVFVTIDAPIICPNRTGTRPVDRLTHTMFHREHAACHPANSTKCPRPPRILRKLQTLGFEAGWKQNGNSKIAAEVYPHPAMVRLFKLDRIVKYKKGPVAERKKEFKRLQRLLKKCLQEYFPFLTLEKETVSLLKKPWSKPIEDQTDALFCALIGLWHVHHRGSLSEVIGNVTTGFILLPIDLRVQ
jgi:predicted RNase H-like nuclease